MQIFLRVRKISCQNQTMPQLHIRRATVDDLPALKSLWLAAHLPADELESRLTEFQVVETGGVFAGALGVQILRQHARLHSEDYADFSVADAARELFWERIQNLAANHGVFRVWTQETSPFWTHWGFQPANRGNSRPPAGRMEKSRRPLAHAGIEKRRRHQRRAAKSIRRLHGRREKADGASRRPGPANPDIFHRHLFRHRHHLHRLRDLAAAASAVNRALTAR